MIKKNATPILLILFCFFLSGNGILAESAGTSQKKINLFPFFSIEQQLFGSNIDRFVYMEDNGPWIPDEEYGVSFKKPSIASLGITVQKSGFFSSVSLNIPWYPDASEMLANLNFGIGYQIKSISLFAGKSVPLYEEQCRDLFQPNNPFYGGVQIAHRIGKNVTMENAILYTYSTPDLSSYKDAFITYELRNRLMLQTRKTISPFVTLSIGKSNVSDKLFYQLGVGVNVGKSAAIGIPQTIVKFGALNPRDPMIAYAPNIYIYPEKKQPVDVKVFPNGKMLSSYPLYRQGWSVIVEPDGSIENTPGYLFYDAEVKLVVPKKGWSVSHDHLFSFLSKTLKAYGLNKTEIRDFLVFWLATLPEASHYAIYPMLNGDIDPVCPLHITPKPKNILRLWLVFKPLSSPIELQAPKIESLNRNGYTVIEWGGLILGDKGNHKHLR